jgi:hypothetical protein
MTATTQFLPTATATFSFQAVLDGQQYTVAVLWNTFGQRWYFQITDVNGNLILFAPLTGAPAPIQIASAFWQSQTVTVTTASPHGFPPGSTQLLTVAGLTPDAYNGQFFALITGSSSFTYQLIADPGAAVVTSGTSVVEPYGINLVQGYFNSTMVFYYPSQTFVVAP